jgi:hypothetical protein
MALAAVLLAGRHPYLALAGLFYLSARSPFGPEASLFGLHQAQAERAAAPQIAAQLEAGDRVWVGSYQAAALSQPWAGVVEAPLAGFFVYGPDTRPGAQATASTAAGAILAPNATTVAGVPARLVNCPTDATPARTMDHTLADVVYDFVI